MVFSLACWNTHVLANNSLKANYYQAVASLLLKIHASAISIGSRLRFWFLHQMARLCRIIKSILACLLEYSCFSEQFSQSELLSGSSEFATQNPCQCDQHRQNQARQRRDDFASRRFSGGDGCEFCRWFCGMVIVKARANISYLPTCHRQAVCLPMTLLLSFARQLH